jgi:hypothetical protein
VRIVSDTVTSQKVRPFKKVLIDVLDKFSSYDLLSEEGVAEASHHIEVTLSPVASFREMEPWMGDEHSIL